MTSPPTSLEARRARPMSNLSPAVHIHRPRPMETFVQVRFLHRRTWTTLRQVNGGDRAKRLAIQALDTPNAKEVRAIQCYEYYEPLTIFQAAVHPYPRPRYAHGDGVTGGRAAALTAALRAAWAARDARDAFVEASSNKLLEYLAAAPVPIAAMAERRIHHDAPLFANVEVSPS